MPHYEVRLGHFIRESKQHELAQKITQLHCRTFHAPSVFVNVSFRPTFWHCRDSWWVGYHYTGGRTVRSRSATTDFSISS